MNKLRFYSKSIVEGVCLHTEGKKNYRGRDFKEVVEGRLSKGYGFKSLRSGLSS